MHIYHGGSYCSVVVRSDKGSVGWCEYLGMDKLDTADEFRKLWESMGKNSKYDECTEVPNLFDELVTHMWMQTNHKFMECVTMADKKFRMLKEAKVVLPYMFEGWLLLHRSDATKEQRDFMVSTTGMQFSFDKVMQ